MNLILYRTKPKTVHAVKITSYNIQMASEWCWGKLIYDATGKPEGINLSTKEKPLIINMGEVLIRHSAGNFSGCSPDEFHEMYEKDVKNDTLKTTS